MTQHTVSTRDEWLAQRLQLLDQEKAFTQRKDELAQARQALPWVKIEKDYRFETPSGQESLAALFGVHSQLVVYHFMFNPNAEVGCKSCSYWADNWRAAVPHLSARDVTLLAVSRAPLAKLEAFKQRQGWKFKWVSSGESEFNYDFAVSFSEAACAAGEATYNYRPLSTNAARDLPGFSVFAKDERGDVFHTYSTFGRGIELMNPTYQLLDLVPKGRDEAELPDSMAWLKFGYDYAERS